MKRATHFMVEEVSVSGGYAWSYLPDKSHWWREFEAYPSMIWVQPGLLNAFYSLPCKM